MKHASSALVLDYWNDRRRNRPAPERGDIDPAEIRQALGDTFMLAADFVDELRFRLAGTRVCALFGREIKGEPFTALWGEDSRRQIDELIEFLDSNHMAWSQTMAPVIMGNADRPELGEELTVSFCRTDPDIARRFARVTFLTDTRDDLGPIDARVLILQCREDAIAPPGVGDFVQRAIPGSELVTLDATGHCPNLSAPDATIAAIRAFV